MVCLNPMSYFGFICHCANIQIPLLLMSKFGGSTGLYAQQSVKIGLCCQLVHTYLHSDNITVFCTRSFQRYLFYTFLKTYIKLYEYYSFNYIFRKSSKMLSRKVVKPDSVFTRSFSIHFCLFLPGYKTCI